MALTVKEKLGWYDACTFDRRLTDRAVRIAHAIGKHLNSDSGATYIAHEKLANKLGTCTKTITRGVAELERYGYLRVTRPKGAGRANHYRPVLPDAREMIDNPPPKNATTLSKKCDNAVQGTGQPSPSYPSLFLSRIPTQKISAAPESPPSPPPPGHVHAEEPAFVRRARLCAEEDDRRMEQALVARLTADDIDGREVVASIGAQRLATLCARLRQNQLTDADVAAAHADFGNLRAQGRIIEFLPDF